MAAGDLIEIHWVDITEDGTGDPARAEMAERISIGFFIEKKESRGIPCIVTSTTKDTDVQAQSGWCIYPEGAIQEIKIIRRGRKNAKKTGSVPSVSKSTRQVRRGARV